MRILAIRITEWLFVIFILGLLVIQAIEFEPELVKQMANQAKQLITR